MNSAEDDLREALARIAAEAENRTGELDLSGLKLNSLPDALFDLHHLTSLTIYGQWGPAENVHLADAARGLGQLRGLEKLVIPGIQLSSLAFLPTLSNLRVLNLARTGLSDLSVLRDLRNLSDLTLASTKVDNLDALRGLENLARLDCSFTEVADFSPLRSLPRLITLNASRTNLSHLRDISDISCLTTLYIQYCKLSDLGPISRLQELRSLIVANSDVRDISPLEDLPKFFHLICQSTSVEDLSPLRRLVTLIALDCSRSKVRDLSPLGQLDKLFDVDVSYTDVSDLTPLAASKALLNLRISGCHIDHLPFRLVENNTLQNLCAFETKIPEIPDEVLSTSPMDNCLERVRAHISDLSSDSTEMADVRLVILGNGGVGKTQIARWLSGEPFDANWDSTHGIRIVGPTSDSCPAATLHLRIWDFGGQDIYHGIHALFLGRPAVLMPVWTEDRENRPEIAEEGITFRNNPLAYWVSLATHQGDRDNPVLIVQNKCDHPQDETLPFPVGAEALQALPYRKQLHVSVKESRGLRSLEVALDEAIAWLRDPSRLGTPLIGAIRLRIQRRIEALQNADSALPREERVHRWMDRKQFEDLCTEEGGVASTDLLLDYLDANGTVFYRRGFFRDRIILDQNWALEAIYAIFDRSGAYWTFRRIGGRFTRTLLGLVVWRRYSAEDQTLLLEMMRSSGICFLHQPFGAGPEEDAEYIAPDLLPERDHVQGALTARWRSDGACETAVFSYPLLHGGLIRSIMAAIGELAGPDALYWRGGLCGFEAQARSRVLIEQEMEGGWRGAIKVSTQEGEADAALLKVVEVVERAQTQLGMKPASVQRSRLAPSMAPTAGLVFSQEKPAASEIYVSYAWGDDTPEGRLRGETVDRLCAAATARGRTVLRDKDVSSTGDSISKFMRRVGQGDRIFVILSDRYLSSPFCMFELSEIWRTSRQEQGTFLDRIRLYPLPDAKYRRPVDRVDWAIHWKTEYEALSGRAEKHGAAVLGEDGQRHLMRMQRFYTQVADILATLADSLPPRDFDELVRYGFGD